MPRRIETKRPHILFMCQKCGERRVGRREWGGGGCGGGGVSLYLPVDITPSMRINSPRQREMREERAWEGGRGRKKEREGRAEMVVVLICQRNTALRVLLKRPHKPELSEVGGRTLTFSHTDRLWIFCWCLATHTVLTHHLYVETCKVALHAQNCGISHFWSSSGFTKHLKLLSFFNKNMNLQSKYFNFSFIYAAL